MINIHIYEVIYLDIRLANKYLVKIKTNDVVNDKEMRYFCSKAETEGESKREKERGKPG